MNWQPSQLRNFSFLKEVTFKEYTILDRPHGVYDINIQKGKLR